MSVWGRAGWLAPTSAWARLRLNARSALSQRDDCLDGTIARRPELKEALDGIRGRATPSHMFVRTLRAVQACLPGRDIHIMILSDGYGEEYHDGFGAAIDELFRRNQQEEAADFAAVAGATLCVGNDEGATRLAVDALVTADIVVKGWGSLLPAVCCQVYRERECEVVNAWSVKLFGEAQQLPGPVRLRLLKAVSNRPDCGDDVKAPA